MDMFRKARAFFLRPPVYRVASNETEFVISGSTGETFVIGYDAIAQITAFKIDRLSEDVICFSVTYVDPLEGKTRSIDVNEDMEGFSEMTARLADTLTGFDKDWRGKLVKPAFAENKTLLYFRNKA